MEVLLTAFITFFTVIDPVGTVPVFIAVTSSVSEKDKKRMAIRAVIVATAVLSFFMILGEIVLDAINIPLSTFQIAGGLILFMFAITMIFGESKAEDEISHIENQEDKAIFPLAMPSLASPGAILAAILLTENSKFSIGDQLMTGLMMILVMLLALTLLLLSTKIFKYIGNSGSAIISRVMGLILSAVAVDNVLHGVKLYFNL